MSGDTCKCCGRPSVYQPGDKIRCAWPLRLRGHGLSADNPAHSISIPANLTGVVEQSNVDGTFTVRLGDDAGITVTARLQWSQLMPACQRLAADGKVTTTPAKEHRRGKA